MAVIYWIEDKVQYLKGIVETFEEEGHKVRVIGNAGDVVARLEKIGSEADLVILDLWLPPGQERSLRQMTQGERGRWLYDKIREELPKEREIVILSGNLDLDTIDAFEKKGLAAEFMKKKPIGFEEYVDFITNLAALQDKNVEEVDVAE